MSLSTLTFFSTLFIVGSGIALLVGWGLIRRKEVRRHRNAMLAASGLAAGFLVLYVTRWALYGSKPFEGDGGWRVVYFANLVPHIVLATLLAPLVIRMIDLALHRGDFKRHKRLARYVLPLWLYVAASGWLVYYLLYVRTY